MREGIGTAIAIDVSSQANIAEAMSASVTIHFYQEGKAMAYRGIKAKPCCSKA
jgi:hypothetical protein